MKLVEAITKSEGNFRRESEIFKWTKNIYEFS